MHNFFYSLITFCIAIFFVMLGIIAILLPLAPVVRADIITYILEDSVLISLFGTALIIIGLTIVFYLIINMQNGQYTIKVKNNQFSINQAVFQEYLNQYWKQLFPKQSIVSRVKIRKNKVHVSADLPHIPLEQQKALLEDIQNDLNMLFAKFIGYNNDYILSINFEGKSTLSFEK